MIKVKHSEANRVYWMSEISLERNIVGFSKECPNTHDLILFQLVDYFWSSTLHVQVLHQITLALSN